MDPNPNPDKKAGRIDRVIAAVLGGILLAFAGWATMSVLQRSSGEDATVIPAGRVTLRERDPGHVRPGDAEHGRKLYGVHCASCHGVRGDGLGPAAAYLWPAPRDHTDAAYMNSRSDRELYRAIAEGGKAVGRSPLMPSWKDRFDAFDAWNLVAFIRTLHAGPPEPAARATFHEVVLSPDRLRDVANALGKPLGGAEHRLAFGRHVTDEDEVLGLSVYPSVAAEGHLIVLGVFFKPDGSLVEVRSHRQVLLKDRSPDEVDRFLSGARDQGAPPSPIPGYEDLSSSLLGSVRKTALKLRSALEQENEDFARARKVYDVFTKSPADLPMGERLYLQNCAQCHGATGRLVGPWITEREFRPRNHADGSFMNLLSDEYVRSVIRYGGLYWNVSAAMPAHPRLTEQELGDLVAFLRSLAVPRGDGRCPCAVMTASCMDGEGPSCRCGEGHAVSKLCDHMRK